MPVFTSLRESKRKTRNRQKYLYGYSSDENAMIYMDASGVLTGTELPNDIVKAAIDFNETNNYAATADSGSYDDAPLITSLSMTGSMGNQISFNVSFLIKIMEDYATGTIPEGLITEPSAGGINFGATRYYCQGANEPEQFSWNVSTNLINSGCIIGEEGSKTAKVKVNSFSSSITQYFTSAYPIANNTYTGETGDTVTVDYCTSALFIPALVGVGTGGSDSKPLVALWDFEVSEKGTEYNADHSDGWLFITAECEGVPEIPGDWIEFPVEES